MAVADKVIVELEARVSKAESDIKRYEAGFRKSMGGVEQSSARAARRQEQEFSRAAKSIRAEQAQIGVGMKALAASIAAGVGASQLIGLADGFTRVTNALKVAGLEGTALKDVQNQLLVQSQTYGVGLEGLAKLYGNLSQSAKELGASSADIMGLTEKTAQALKITGTSAAQAQGAILGLNQAMASGRVSIEEYNQMNEGGLRPLLQAAANTEQFGGSIAKLREHMKETGISGAELFRLINEGGASMEATAGKAVLTLSGGFEALSSSIMVYMGEADQANGVSAALGQAMVTLSQNLDVLADAIAVVMVLVGSRWVASLTKSTIAAVANAVANQRAAAAASSLAASKARATAVLGANTAATNVNTAALGRGVVAMGLMRGAALGLTAALGGPLGIALAAVALGFGYMAAESANAEAELANLKQTNDETAASLAVLEQRARDAGIKVGGTGDAAKAAKDWFKKLLPILGMVAGNYARVANNARAARIEMAEAKLSAARSARSDARREAGGRPFSVSAETQSKLDESDRAVALAERDLALAKAVPDALQEKVYGENTAPIGGGAGGAPRYIRSVGTDYHRNPHAGGTPKAPTGPSQAELDARAAAEQRALDAEILALGKEETRLLSDRIGEGKVAKKTADERMQIDFDLLELERQERQAQLDANKDLTAEQRAKQQAAIDKLYGPAPNGDIITNRGLKGLAIEAGYQDEGLTALVERKKKYDEMQIDLAQARYDAERAEFELMLDGAKTKAERYDIERSLLQLDHNAKAAAIDALDVDEKIKAEKRKQLAAETQISTNALSRAYASPLESYMADTQEIAGDLDTTFGNIAVDGIESLNDGITDAIMGAKSLGDVFSNVAKQIIADLVQIAIRMAIFEGLKALNIGVGSGNSGGGMIGVWGGLSGKVPGNAMGGAFTVGGNSGTDNNVLSINGNPVRRVSMGETVSIRPSGMGGGSNGGQSIYVDARGALMNDQFAQMILTKSKGYAAEAGKAAYGKAMRDAPSAVGAKQRYG